MAALLFLVGIISTGIGAIFFWMAVGSGRDARRLQETEALTVAELADLKQISDELGSRGLFSKICESTGEARPGADGPLVAELSGVDCVWHEHWVERRRLDEGGEPTRDPMVRQASRSGWTLVGADGRTIDVDRARLLVNRAEKVVDRFDRATVGAERSSLDGTIGYERKEWILRPGTVVHVRGEVHDRHGSLSIGPRSGSSCVEVSTSAKPERIRGGHVFKGCSARTGAVLVLVGLVLIVGTVLLG